MTPTEFNSEPPATPVAEEVLLGCLMELGADRNATVALDNLGPDDFSTEASRITFEAIQRLHGRGEAADPMSVLSELQRHGRGQFLAHTERQRRPLPPRLRRGGVGPGCLCARASRGTRGIARRRVYRSALRLCQASGSASSRD